MKDLSLAISILKDIKTDTKDRIDTLADMVDDSSRLTDVINIAEFVIDNFETQITRMDQIIDYLEQINKM
jgi:hypothetical protein